MAHPAPSTSASATESDQKKEREDTKTKKKEGKKQVFTDRIEKKPLVHVTVCHASEYINIDY